MHTTDLTNLSDPTLKAMVSSLLTSGDILGIRVPRLPNGWDPCVDIWIPVTGVPNCTSEPLHIALDRFGRIEWQDFSHRTVLGSTAESAANMIRLILKHPPGTFTTKSTGA